MAQNTRPSTDADCVVFAGANTLTNARNLQAWIREKQLARNQIIAITSNENDIEEGDQVLTLFYRKISIVPGASPVDNIQFNSFNNQQSWEKQEKAANDFKVSERRPDIISVSRTPKNIGNARCQTVWYTNEMGNPDTYSHLVSRKDGDWTALASETHQWLNEHLPPHELLSVTMFEEAHPNQTGKIGALITHKAGPNPRRLSETPAGTNSFVSEGLYSMEIVRHEETNGAVHAALQVINRKGGQEGHVVSTTNDSQQQDIFCVVYSWNALYEAQLVDDLRPEGCCTIF